MAEGIFFVSNNSYGQLGVGGTGWILRIRCRERH
jgi:hypothetical protein